MHRGPLDRRSSGVLLHPTSLPARHGIGDLGPSAHQFVDFLAAAGQALWQVLPLNPTSLGDSPYSSPSAFAGSALLISLDRLAEQGLLAGHQVDHHPSFPRYSVDYQRAWTFKSQTLRIAWQEYSAAGGRKEWKAFDTFCTQNRGWLDDYALFMALRNERNGRQWTTWEPALASHEGAALARSRDALATEIDFQRFLQFLFHSQWTELRNYAHRRGVRIVGDVPIFVAHDSVDVWAHRQFFHLDGVGRPTVVAGVPPDYFSSTGQLWGNPLYRWDRLAADGYAWWIDRLRSALKLFDAVRIDHFRGFQAYWQVPADHETAQHGEWARGPGLDLFAKLETSLGRIPVIVEDLGLITQDVVELRQRLGYPGMKVLQFGFDGDAGNPYLPHNYERNCVVYTATHDNDTALGWFTKLNAAQRQRVRHYLGTSGKNIGWDLIRLALSSVANTVIIPLQDILNLPSWARMNFPGKPSGNWRWRAAPGQVSAQHAQRLADLVESYGRGAQ